MWGDLYTVWVCMGKHPCTIVLPITTMQTTTINMTKSGLLQGCPWKEIASYDSNLCCFTQAIRSHRLQCFSTISLICLSKNAHLATHVVQQKADQSPSRCKNLLMASTLAQPLCSTPLPQGRQQFGHLSNVGVLLVCKGNLTIEHHTQILARGIQRENSKDSPSKEGLHKEQSA